MLKKRGTTRASLSMLTHPVHDTTRSVTDQNLDRDDTNPRVLRLLSYNIQTGIATSRYHHYLTHSWKHVLPCPGRRENLDRIASLARHYDFVALQEADAGSLRSGYINITEYLAHRAGFPHWHDQTNRNFGMFAQHSMGALSRMRATEISEHRLPGAIPGRGALFIRYGRGDDSLVVLLVHLALGRRARLRQLGMIGEMAADYRHVIVMGDLNCTSSSPELSWMIRRAGLSEPHHDLHTFPSWRPVRNIDHILVSPTLRVSAVNVLNHPLSDHLPIAMEVTLPESVRLEVPHHAAWDRHPHQVATAS
jgi:endonuclease/exonuclease/phosphatase family metal-dependent hydrolase